MFRKTSPQLSLFEVDRVFPDSLPKEDWCYTYRDRIYPLIDEDKFRHLYDNENGRPNTSIKKAVSIIIFMGMEKLSWRAAAFQYPRRLDWLIATRTPLGKVSIDHSTLFKFFVRLEADTTARRFFQKLTEKFADACGTSLKKQRTDSFFIHGWLRILSRYGLFKETIRVFLQNLRKQKPGLYENIRNELSRNYLAKDFDITEKDREQAARQVQKMAEDMWALCKVFSSHHQVKHYESFQTLSAVFHQQCEVIREKEPESESRVVIREKPEGEQIISSPHNTASRYTKKGDQAVCGQRGFLSESCDTSNKTQFITDAEVTPATTADVKELPHIHERLEESRMKPEEQYCDAGFVNGGSILDAQEKGISLEGPSAGRSQSFESFHAEERPFDAADFEVTIEKSKELIVLSCPAKQTPLNQSRSAQTGKLLIHFDSTQCASCKKNTRCPVKIGVRVATLTIDEASYVGAFRHHRYMGSKEYRKQCAIRAGVEATVSELVRSHGMRKSKHRRESRTRLQFIFAAIACNVKRFIRHGALYGYTTPPAAFIRVGIASVHPVKAFLRTFRISFEKNLSFVLNFISVCDCQRTFPDLLLILNF